MRTNATYGVVLNVTFKLKKKKNFKYFVSESDYFKCYSLAQNLISKKKELGIRDIVIINSHDATEDDGNHYQIIVKISEEKVTNSIMLERELERQ